MIQFFGRSTPIILQKATTRALSPRHFKRVSKQLHELKEMDHVVGVDLHHELFSKSRSIQAGPSRDIVGAPFDPKDRMTYKNRDDRRRR